MIPLHLSYSTYTSWSCRKAYELGKIELAPPKPAVYFAGGTAVHEACEDHDRGDRVMGSWESYFYPEISAGMEDHAGLYWDTKKWLMGGPDNAPDTPETWATIGPQCIENWIKFTKDEFTVHENSIEYDATGILPGCPIPIKGFIDRTGIHKDHGDMIIDIKSGKSKPKDSFQLGVYRALMLQKLGAAPTKGAYFMAREGRIIGKPVDLTEYTPERVGKIFGDLYAEMQAAEKAADYPPNRQFTCKWCTQQDNCLAYSGMTAQAKHYDPDYRNGKPGY